MAYSSVRTYVYALVNIFPGPLRTVGKWVADRVFSTWDEIFQLLSIFRPLWVYFHAKVTAFVSAVFWVAEETARTLRWLVIEALPKWARWALDTAVSYAKDGLSTLRNWAVNEITTVRQFLSQLISSVLTFAKSVLSWTIDQVREVWDTLSVIRDRVVLLLTNPEGFVDWVFAALWRRFWRFLNDHAEAIAGAAFLRRDAIIAQGLTRLEAFLVRIL